MPRPNGQLERSIAALTIGAQQGAHRRRVGLTDTRTGEYEQQVHVPLSGNASATWAFTDQSVHWELPFLYAPLQRTVPFPTPHFTPGIEMLTASDLVLIHAQVEAWTITEEAWYVGASIRFAAVAPLAAGTVAFTAIAHLSFEGYAALAEGDEFTTD